MRRRFERIQAAACPYGRLNDRSTRPEKAAVVRATAPCWVVGLAAVVARVVATQPAAHAVRGAVHEPRCARPGRRRKRLASIRPSGPLRRFARGLVRGLRASARRPAHPEGQGDGDPRDRHVVVDAGQRREADTARRRAGSRTSLPRSRPWKASRRSRPVRGRGAGRRPSDDRPRPGRAVDRRSRGVSGPSAERRSATRSQLRSSWQTVALGGKGNSRAPGGAGAGGEGPGLDPLPLRRLPDARDAAPFEGAERAKAAGFPVHTVALGTPEGT